MNQKNPTIIWLISHYMNNIASYYYSLNMFKVVHNIVAFRWGWIWQWKFLACFIDFKMLCFHPNHDLVLHYYKLVLMFKYVTKYTLKKTKLKTLSESEI